jgi:hypothetical protein
LAICQWNLIILPQNISITPYGPKCKYTSCCSIFYKHSEYCNLEIALCGKQELLMKKKKTNIHCQLFNRFSPKICSFCPKINSQMHKLCLSHQLWIFMISIIRKRVIMSYSNYNDLIIHFFKSVAIF